MIRCRMNVACLATILTDNLDLIISIILYVAFSELFECSCVNIRAGNNRFKSIRIDVMGESIRYGKSKTNGVQFSCGHVVRSLHTT